MRFPVLDEYWRHLPTAAGVQHRIWLNAQGQAQGRYFNCALTSVFQSVRRLGTGEVVWYEVFPRSSSEDNAALSIFSVCTSGCWQQFPAATASCSGGSWPAWDQPAATLAPSNEKYLDVRRFPGAEPHASQPGGARYA
jgi:hypothetical protein